MLAPCSDYFKVPVYPLHSPAKIRALNKSALERRRRINSLQNIKKKMFCSPLSYKLLSKSFRLPAGCRSWLSYYSAKLIKTNFG